MMALNRSDEFALRSSSFATTLRKTKSTKLGEERAAKNGISRKLSTDQNQLSTSHRAVLPKPVNNEFKKTEKLSKNAASEKIFPLRGSSLKSDLEKTTQQLKTLARRLESSNVENQNSSSKSNVKRSGRDENLTNKSHQKLPTESIKKNRYHIETLPAVEPPKPRFNVFKALDSEEKPIRSLSSESKIKLTESCTKALIKQDIVIKNKATDKKSSKIWKY